MKTLRKIFIRLMTVCFVGSTAYAQSTVLDTSFNHSGGVLLCSILKSTHSNCVAIQNDGKVIVGGYFTQPGFSLNLMITRYQSNGDLDSLFGYNGTFLYSVNPSAYSPEIITIIAQDNGKIIALGNEGIPWHSTILRLNNNGTLDTTFNHFGKVNVGLPLIANDIALSNNNRIIIAGSNNNGNFLVAAYDSTGSVDSTFGVNGLATIPVTNLTATATSLAIQLGNKILVGGYCGVNANFDFAVARLDSSGMADTTFGTAGKTITHIAADDFAFDMVIDSLNNKFYLAGYSTFFTTNHLAMARYNANGILDNTFGNMGKVYTTGNDHYRANAMALQQNNKIVLAGFFVDSLQFHHGTVMRYTYNGTIDSTFNNIGIFPTIPSAGSRGSNNGICIQQDGKIVTSGYISFGTFDCSIANRFLTELNVDVLTSQTNLFPFTLFPNPITTTATLEYILTQNESITINLSDMQGRLIQTFMTNAPRTSGNHKEQLSFGNEIAAGNYVLTIENGDSVKFSIKLIKH